MAFCNSCGTTITPGTRFCSKCGAPILASGVPSGATPVTSPASATPSVPPPQGQNNTLRIVLILVGAVVVLGALVIGGLTVVGLHLARKSRVTQDGNHVKVETPFGTVESTKDPEQAAKNLGIDIYPGAEVQQNGAATATFGNMRTVNASFESSDSVGKVCNFYRSRFPNATVSTSDENHCTIVSNGTPPNVLTINIEPNGEGSKFQVSSVSNKKSSDQ